MKPKLLTNPFSLEVLTTYICNSDEFIKYKTGRYIETLNSELVRNINDIMDKHIKYELDTRQETELLYIESSLRKLKGIKTYVISGEYRNIYFEQHITDKIIKNIKTYIN